MPGRDGRLAGKAQAAGKAAVGFDAFIVVHVGEGGVVDINSGGVRRCDEARPGIEDLKALLCPAAVQVGAQILRAEKQCPHTRGGRRDLECVFHAERRLDQRDEANCARLYAAAAFDFADGGVAAADGLPRRGLREHDVIRPLRHDGL